MIILIRNSNNFLLLILLNTFNLFNFANCVEDSICLEVITQTTTTYCADISGFSDVHGFDCSSNQGYDCITDNLEYEYTENELMEIVTNCAKACGLCKNSNGNMEIEIIDVQTNAIPELLSIS